MRECDGCGTGGTAPCGWYGTVSDFLRLSEADLLASLHDRHLQVMGMQPGGGQIVAWRGEYTILAAVLGELVGSKVRASDWVVVFECELPRERGRRLDVVILTGSQVLVLEFKESDLLLRAHLDQVSAYARDLSEYHAASHDKLIEAVLVLTRASEERRAVDNVVVVNPRGLLGAIMELENELLTNRSRPKRGSAPTTPRCRLWLRPPDGSFSTSPCRTFAKHRAPAFQAQSVSSSRPQLGRAKSRVCTSPW